MVRLISWNVNGARAVQQRGQLDWLWSPDNDVVCLQETKATVEQLESLLEPAGWQRFFCSGERKGYSGVATFVRGNEQAKLLSKGMGIERFDNEGRMLVTDHGAFVLFNVYFPNGGRSEERLRYKLDFYDAFLNYVKTFQDAGRQVVICGDVNTAHKDIDLSQPEKNADVSGALPSERAWMDTLLEAGFIDTFRAEHGERPGQYTWWDMRTFARQDNRGWRIDYFFVSDPLEDYLLDAWISPQIMGSDHCPVGLELDVDVGNLE